MILLATTREPVAQLPGAKRLDRIYKAVAAVFMPQASSVYAFLALSIASGIEETPLYLLLAILFASLIELGSLLVYVRFLKRAVNVQDRKDRPMLCGIAILSYLIGLVLLRDLGAPFIFSALMFAYFANTAFAAVITRHLTKVSIHTWGITGPSVAILYSFGVLGFLLMLVIGAIVGSTRIKHRISYLETSCPFISYVDSFYMVHCVHYSPVSSDRFQSLLTVSSQFMTGRLMLPGKLN